MQGGGGGGGKGRGVECKEEGGGVYQFLFSRSLVFIKLLLNEYLADDLLEGNIISRKSQKQRRSV